MTGDAAAEATIEPAGGDRGYDDGWSRGRRDIGIRLTVLARVLRHSFDREVADLNITRSQWGLIAVVHRRPGATQRMIAEMLEMSEASAGRLVDRLCLDGLLERRDREDDRRARAVFLTAAAEPLLAELAKVAKASEERLFKGFSDEEIAMLERLLDRLYANSMTA